MNKTKPLTLGQKHVLKLIARDRAQDGWTSVSVTLYKLLSETIPPELATFEPTGDSGRAKLTVAGQGVVDAMVWLS